MKRLLRAITPAEVERLVAQGCSAESWDEVWVPEQFDIAYVVDVHFSGTVCLGAFRKSFTLPGGYARSRVIKSPTFILLFLRIHYLAQAQAAPVFQRTHPIEGLFDAVLIVPMKVRI